MKIERRNLKWIPKLLLIHLGLAMIIGCKKDDDAPVQASNSPCLIKSAPSYFGTPQTFEYNQNGNLASRRFEFNTPGYGPFTQTVDPAKIFYTYTTQAARLEVTDIFIGGTGNLYDAQPEMVVRNETQKYTNGSPDFISTLDTVLLFEYDSQKRLSVITHPYKLITYDITSAYSKQLFSMKLELKYDNNDNVIKLEQTAIYREGVYVVNSPSDSYFVYLNAVQTVINVAYENKPSPFTAMSKYWKFVQGDWGYVTNSNWQAIITALSKNNPITITYETFQGKPSTAKTNIAYNYNEQGFPIDGYVYSCK